MIFFAGKISYARNGGVELFVNGESQPVYDALERAERRIDIEIYSIKDPGIFSRLLAAAKRGVKVRIVKEEKPVGESCRVFDPAKAGDADCVRQRNFITDLRAAGGEVKAFNRVGLCPATNPHCLQHGKILLIDDAAYLSTGNLNSSSLCVPADAGTVCNRDYTVGIGSPDVLEALAAVFEADFAGETYDITKLVSKRAWRTLTISPVSAPAMLGLINSAKKSLQIETQYLYDPLFNEALIRAADRGVEISVVVSGICSFGFPAPRAKERAQRQFEAFDRAGIAVRAYRADAQINGMPSYMHAKAIVIDGKTAWVGSINGSSQSLRQNREFGIIFGDAAPLARLSQTMSDDWEKSSETWQQNLNCRPLPKQKTAEL